ncbi:MAG: hypothetical protein AAF194_08655 [Pseudomonadota bacterium]
MKRLSKIAFGLAMLVLALAPLNVQAEAAYANTDWANLQQQLTTSLDSPVESIQVSAMQHIVFFSANFAENVNFRSSTDKLMRIYTDHDDERMRVLALQALNAIGGYIIMEQLADYVETESSDRVRKLTNAVLANYYRA